MNVGDSQGQVQTIKRIGRLFSMEKPSSDCLHLMEMDGISLHAPLGTEIALYILTKKDPF